MRGCQQGLCGRVSVTAWKRLLVSSALERARLRDVELAPRPVARIPVGVMISAARTSAGPAASRVTAAGPPCPPGVPRVLPWAPAPRGASATSTADVPPNDAASTALKTRGTRGWNRPVGSALPRVRNHVLHSHGPASRSPTRAATPAERGARTRTLIFGCRIFRLCVGSTKMRSSEWELCVCLRAACGCV